jgi:hypothetical protein
MVTLNLDIISFGWTLGRKENRCGEELATWERRESQNEK